jgi:hypothetical protein
VLPSSFGGAFHAPDPRAGDLQQVERFGQRGQWVISAEHGLAVVTGTSAFLSEHTQPGRVIGSLVLVAHADYFVADHLSVGFSGGLGGLGVDRDGETSAGNALFVGFQLGGAIWLGKSKVLWPKASGLWARSKGSLDTYAQFFVPVAAEVGHLLVGVGPTFEWTHLSADRAVATSNETALGVTFLLAGWWR